MSLALFRAALLSYNDTPESLTKEILETMGKMYAWFPQLADTIDTVLENHKAYLLKEQEKLRVYDTIMDEIIDSPGMAFNYDAGQVDVQQWYERVKNELGKKPRQTVF
jgi:hypothetical protein